MPYFIQKRGSEHCVMEGTKESPGETKKCHPTKKEAVAHMGALYVHVEDARATVADAVTTNVPHGEGGYLPHGSQYGTDRECPECGADLSENAKKCPKCGKKLKGGVLMDRAVKSLGGDRIGQYAAVWGDAENLDLVDEYFSPETDFWLGTWATVPILYHHGYNPELKGWKSKVGTWDKLEPDDIGLWVEGELEKHHAYRDGIGQLIEEKALYLSTGALPTPGYIEVAPDGHIKSWPVVEISLTPMPMEPRLADIAFLKSACEIDLDAERIRREVQTMSTVLNKEEKGFLATLLEKLNITKTEEIEEVKVEKAKETEEDEEDKDKEDDEDDEDDEDEEEKGLDTKALEPIIESVIKAVTDQVGTFMAKAQEDLKAILNSELAEIRLEMSDFNNRLEGTEKTIEQRVAEKLDNLPEIVRAPVSATDATVRDGEEPIKSDKQVNPWLESMVMPMVENAMREFTPRSFLDVDD